MKYYNYQLNEGNTCLQEVGNSRKVLENVYSRLHILEVKDLVKNPSFGRRTLRTFCDEEFFPLVTERKKYP